MKTPSRLANYALFLGSVAITVLLAEAVLRIPGVRPPLEGEYMIDFPRSRMPHPRLLVADPIWLRAERYRVRPGKQRVIVALGDSYTESLPVSRENAYPAVLEKRLNAAGWNVQVINSGIANSGPGRQVRLFTDYVLPVTRPDIVIWQFYWNDIADEWMMPVHLLENGKLVDNPDLANNWMYRRQWLVEHSPIPRSLWRRSALMRLALKLFERGEGKEVPAGIYNQDWSAAKICLYIKQMEELARQHGFTLVLVHVDAELNYLADRASRKMPWIESGERLLNQEFACAPSAPVIQVRFPAADPNTIFAGLPRERAPVGDRHFNETGYAMMADLVSQALAPAAALSGHRAK